MTGSASVRWRRPWWFLPVVVVAVASLAAGLIVGLRLVSGWGAPPVASAGSPVRVHVVRGRAVRIPAMRPYHAPPVSWPAAAAATAAIVPARAGAETVPLAAGPSAGSARAGGLPVWVGPPDTGAAEPGGRPGTAAYVTGTAVSRVLLRGTFPESVEAGQDDDYAKQSHHPYGLAIKSEGLK
jgi:hypothetical protein